MLVLCYAVPFMLHRSFDDASVAFPLHSAYASIFIFVRVF